MIKNPKIRKMKDPETTYSTPLNQVIELKPEKINVSIKHK